MIKRENIIAIAIIAGAMLLVVAVAIVGGGGGSATPDSVAGKTLTAKGGTARKNARPLLSKKRKHDDVGEGAAAASGKPPSKDAAEAPPPAGGSQQAAPPPSKAVQAVEQALNALSPEQGIESLNRHLAELGALAEASQLYATRSSLIMRKIPSDPTAALADLAQAKQLAQTPEDNHYATRVEADMLMRQGEPGVAGERIQETLAANPSATLPGLELRLTLARLREEQGDTDAAETTYKQAMDEASVAADTLGPKAIDQYRLAALRLARLYRRTGRSDEADAVAKAVRERLGE